MEEIVNNNELFRLEIARLNLVINSPGYDFINSLPICHPKFINNPVSEEQNSSDHFKTMMLSLQYQPRLPEEIFTAVICRTKIWELWNDHKGHLIFFPPMEHPRRVIIIEPEFNEGTIIVESSREGDKSIYPLLYIDMVIFSNWLAHFGDLILHASGIAYDGYGYAFAGVSGKGKSTLVRDMANQKGVTVLGEDQVILRLIDGHFWIFGTPWHLDPEICTPRGVPIKKLFLLDRQADRVVSDLRLAEVITQIMRSAFVPFYRAGAVNKILDNLSAMSGKLTFHTLAYQRGSDVLSDILGA